MIGWAETMKMRTLLIVMLVPLFVTLQACGSWWLPRPHKIVIQQGNLLSTEDIAKITVGMSQAAVQTILGDPLTSNHINPDRWEYIYTYNRAGKTPKVKRLSLVFRNLEVAEIEKDGLVENADS